MDVLTYEEIRDAERKEKDSQSLVLLNPDFINRFNDYLADKRRILEKDDDNLISKKLKSQSENEFKNARDSFNRIFTIRARKLLDQAFIDIRMGASINDNNMLDFEKSLYNAFKDLMINHFNNLSKKNIKKEDAPKKLTSDNIMARFVSDVPEFAWADSVLGPFKKEDVVNLPKSLVELLLNKKVIEVI